MNAEFISRHALRLGTMLALASFTLVPGNAAEQNWPIWRGPLASGAAPDAGQKPSEAHQFLLVCLDRATGKTLWQKVAREEVPHELLWECRGMTANAIPSPVAQDGLVYCISGFRGNALLAIRLGRTGDLTDTDAIAWRHNKSTPYVPSPLLYAGKLYFFSNNNGLISCFSAKDGQPLFEAERVEALPNVYASPVGAAGRVYLVGRNGATVVLKQSDKFEVLATNRLEDGSDASPALAGRDLFLRGHEHLYCLAEP